MGVLATRRIPAGTILLRDPAAITIHEPSADVIRPSTDIAEGDKEIWTLLLRMALLQLVEQYASLSNQARWQLAGLHAHMETDALRHLRAALGAAVTDNDHQSALIERLYFTFATNEFSRMVPEDGWRTRRLFLLTSRINHSCCPNARSSQTTDGYKVVTALRDIEEGEEVTLRYLDHHRLGREEWREATRCMWGFVCNCRGCAGKLDA